MANQANETVVYPFTSFNFRVEIHVPDISKGVLCSAAFSECDGLEMTMDVKTIREGGNNTAQIRLIGPTSYGQLTLKRGMTANFDLWHWFTATTNNIRLRGEVTVVLLAPDGRTVRASFLLSRCLPVKLKAPALNAKDGMVAVEELQLAYESLTIKPGGPAGSGFGASVGAGISIG